ncbi:MBL fold metallo-hydrolase [uncultured Pseudokineococcus sp.]|uniref:MBL fold metallo-hydrolase n=1 Tax=uncultured Pseudokineococcus sp. TaxID=1642928 RepID=UPI002605D8CC|nr:MBL fold metallo-hydrolase [uncultured Pseudokineococcus sp.]
MRLTVVGCSGSLPGPGGAASCYLLEADEGPGRRWRVLLDLGSGALGPLQRLVDLHALDAVLLSHLHADHCLDLCGLHVARTYDPALRERPAGRAEPLTVLGPAGTAEHLAAAYGPGAAPELAASFAVRTWRAWTPLALGPWDVLVDRVDHPVEAYGIRLRERATGAVLTYTGDTDACPAVVDLARDADLLLAEAAFHEGRDAQRGVHLTGRRAAEVARDAGARSLLLTHLPPWNDPARTLGEAGGAGYAGAVALAEPGLVVDVGPPPRR